MQTAVEWLLEKLENYDSDIPYYNSEAIIEAKEMEKQQIIDAAERWKGTDFAEKYYAETYGSKGSDEYPLLEGTMNLCNDIISSQTEISDEEIENEAEKITNIGNRREYWKQGIKWYREQLKSRQ